MDLLHQIRKINVIIKPLNMQEFIINKGSTNPSLEMELINDGRYDFQKSLFNLLIQDSVVTFNMEDETTGIRKISKAKANVVLSNDYGCEEKYILQYKWSTKDVSKTGIYKGWFEIKFNGNIISENIDFPQGNLIVPIEENLRIIIK